MLNYLIQWQRIELKNKSVHIYKYVRVFAFAIRCIFLLLHAYWRFFRLNIINNMTLLLTDREWMFSTIYLCLVSLYRSFQLDLISCSDTHHCLFPYIDTYTKKKHFTEGTFLNPSTKQARIKIRQCFVHSFTSKVLCQLQTIFPLYLIQATA